MHTFHDSSHHCLTNQRPLLVYLSICPHPPHFTSYLLDLSDMMTSNPFVPSGFYFFTPQDPSHCAVKLPHHFVQYCANIADEVAVNVVQSLVPLSFSPTFAPSPNIQILVLLSLFFSVILSPCVFSLHYHSFSFSLARAVQEVIRQGESGSRLGMKIPPKKKQKRRARTE